MSWQLSNYKVDLLWCLTITFIIIQHLLPFIISSHPHLIQDLMKHIHTTWSIEAHLHTVWVLAYSHVGVKISQGSEDFCSDMFHPVESFPKFTKMSGSLKQTIFDELYCRLINNLIQKQIFIMACNHTLC